MIIETLLLLNLIALLLVLWMLMRRREKKPDEEPLPEFPIPRPQSNFIEPPRQEVKISFIEDDDTIRIEPPNLILAPNKQAAWSSPSGKVEIRFSPRDSPFGGSSFIAATNGVSLSGIPREDAQQDRQINYIVLFTTTDGRLFSQTATVVVSERRRLGQSD
ncbi:MAG: hypothetical protein ACREBD_02280 [Blastocatellia bacterium]